MCTVLSEFQICPSHHHHCVHHHHMRCKILLSHKIVILGEFVVLPLFFSYTKGKKCHRKALSLKWAISVWITLPNFWAIIPKKIRLESRSDESCWTLYMTVISPPIRCPGNTWSFRAAFRRRFLDTKLLIAWHSPGPLNLLLPSGKRCRSMGFVFHLFVKQSFSSDWTSVGIFGTKHRFHIEQV